MLTFIFSCSSNKGVYWCGDHPCINKDEKEAYFKKNMIVEVKDYNKKNIKKDSEIEKIINQAKLDEKKRKFDEKELKKRTKLEEKRLIKLKKLEEKKIKREEKKLLKQLELEEKERKKSKKKSSRKLKINKDKIKKEKNETKNITNVNNVKNDPFQVKNAEIHSNKFEDLVKNIIKKNSSRPYPEINDIPK